MKLSTRARYGLRAMIALAHNYPEGPLSLSEIARSENISLSYLEQVMAVLRKVSLVEATRGAHGGYQLAAKPASITAGQVLRALDGPISLAECVSEGTDSGYCPREAECPTKPLWEHVRDSITQVLDTTTLADLCHSDKMKV